MSNKLKLTFIISMTGALFFGFLHLIPGVGPYNFERLHIFLFNLGSGGTIVIYYTEQLNRLSRKAQLFFLLAIAYAVFAFLKIYEPTIVIALLLAAIVELVRIRRFSFFPFDFFRLAVDTSRKFHQASLLCLSSGLVISALVILNNEFYTVFDYDTLVLDVFFLGFSFPLSLITMSVMFSFMKQTENRTVLVLKDIAFWAINLGVIVFFIFIIFELSTAELIVSSILFFAVILIFGLYLKLGLPIQQKNFLTSGMMFLFLTAISGVGYIYVKFHLAGGDYYEDAGGVMLLLHAFVALYGWNLSGLVVICRFDDFPIQLNSRLIISLHWLIVILLAPLGKNYLSVALIATALYCALLFIIFFSGSNLLQNDKTKTAC
jgi:hypothetical protein